MANHLRRDRRLQENDIFPKKPSKRLVPKNTLPQPEPNEQEKPQESNLSPSPKAWLKKLLHIGK